MFLTDPKLFKATYINTRCCQHSGQWPYFSPHTSDKWCIQVPLHGAFWRGIWYILTLYNITYCSLCFQIFRGVWWKAKSCTLIQEQNHRQTHNVPPHSSSENRNMYQQLVGIDLVLSSRECQHCFFLERPPFNLI